MAMGPLERCEPKLATASLFTTSPPLKTATAGIAKGKSQTHCSHLGETVQGEDQLLSTELAQSGVAQGVLKAADEQPPLAPHGQALHGQQRFLHKMPWDG